jgi:hypothetical protein
MSEWILIRLMMGEKENKGDRPKCGKLLGIM